jgi:hypothetical protein
MTATVHRLMRKDREQLSWALQLLLTSAEWAPSVRQELTSLLQTVESDPWVYFMSNPVSYRDIVRKLARGTRAGTNLTVWNIALTYAEFGTGEIKATRQQIADDANTHHTEVSRALNRLVEVGALVKVGHGRFALHPHITWIGSLDERRQAAAKLELVEPA